MRLTTLALALLLAGCGSIAIPFAKPADTISVDRMAAAKMLADVSAAEGAVAIKVKAYCAAGKITPDDCQTAVRLYDRYQTFKDGAWKALMTPGVAVDWAAVGEVLKLLVSIAMKL